MRDEGFITPYREALQLAGQCLSDATFKTFIMLMSHANDLGVCFPGYRRLVELTLHEVQRIGDEMQELMSRDMVRQLEAAQQDRFGRWTPALYQINPQIYRLSEKKFEAAMALWNSIEQNIEQKVPVQTLTSIVSIELESESEAENRSIKEKQKTAAATEFFHESENPNAGQVAKWQFQNAAPEQGAIQRGAQSGRVSPSTPPSSAAPPTKYEPLPEISERLPAEVDETLAERIRKETKIPIKLARGLVDKFGYELTKNALRSDFVTTARKPGGALRHLLEKQSIGPEEMRELSSRRIVDDFEDFITR